MIKNIANAFSSIHVYDQLSDRQKNESLFFERSLCYYQYKSITPSFPDYKTIYKKVFVPKYKTIYKFLKHSLLFFQPLILSIVLKYEKSTLNAFIHKGQFSNSHIFFRQIYYTVFPNTSDFCKPLSY